MKQNKLFDTNTLLWQFEELVKTLIAMSLSYEGQKHYYGCGAVADEMLEDFRMYYTSRKDRFDERKLIDTEAKKLLEDIDALTDRWTLEKEEDFWLDPDRYRGEWDILRNKAKLALAKMNKDNLTVEVSRDNVYDEQGNIVFQSTATNLVEK